MSANQPVRDDLVRILKDPYLYAVAIGSTVMLMAVDGVSLAAVKMGVLFALSFLLFDRLQARWRTGSWLGQPEDETA